MRGPVAPGGARITRAEHTEPRSPGTTARRPLPPIPSRLRGRAGESSVQYTELEQKTIDELRELAREVDIPEPDALKKQELIFRLLQAEALQGAPLTSSPPATDRAPTNGARVRDERGERQ